MMRYEIGNSSLRFSRKLNNQLSFIEFSDYQPSCMLKPLVLKMTSRDEALIVEFVITMVLDFNTAHPRRSTLC